MILTFLPALPVHQIPSASSTPFQKTKARLGIHEDMLKEPRMIFYVFFLVILSNIATSAEPSGSWCGKMGLAEQMFSLLCNIQHFRGGSQRFLHIDGWKGASLLWCSVWQNWRKSLRSICTILRYRVRRPFPASLGCAAIADEKQSYGICFTARP